VWFASGGCGGGRRRAMACRKVHLGTSIKFIIRAIIVNVILVIVFIITGYILSVSGFPRAHRFYVKRMPFNKREREKKEEEKAEFKTMSPFAFLSLLTFCQSDGGCRGGGA
jgi:hypothetical protein